MDATRPYVVIPAGGGGTRLWPLSRAAAPKFLHPLTGGDRSLLQATYDRLVPLSSPDRVLVITGQAHAAAVTAQLPDLPASGLVAEPFGRDSCAAIGLAAAIVQQREPGAVMGSFAADHHIRDLDRFADTVRAAVRGAEAGLLMTVGMTPTRPETGYGYVQCGEETDVPGVRRVLRFQEKPPLDVATRYVESGDHLWNASVFVWRADVFLAALEKYSPEIHATLRELAAAWDTDGRDAAVERLWPTLPKLAVEYAVMEPAALDGLVGTVPGDFGWHDVGDFQALGEILDADAAGTVVVPGGRSDAGLVVTHDTKDVVVHAGGGRVVTLVGVQDVVVVDTGDAVLVCARDRAQDVKAITELLRAQGRDDVL